MTALTLMAQVLHQELHQYGVTPLPPIDDCEAIMRALVERTAAAGERLEREVAGK